MPDSGTVYYYIYLGLINFAIIKKYVGTPKAVWVGIFKLGYFSLA